MSKFFERASVQMSIVLVFGLSAVTLSMFLQLRIGNSHRVSASVVEHLGVVNIKDPNFPRWLRTVFASEKLQRRKEARKYIDAYSERILYNPSSVEAYSQLGAVWARLGEIELAKKFLSKSIELSPSADAFFYRGLVYADEHFHELAVKDFDAAIKLSPANPEYYRARAWSRGCIKLSTGAYEDFSTSIKLKRDARTLTDRGLLSYFILRDFKGALRDAQDAERLAPGFIPAIALQSRVLLSMGNLEAARRLSKIVISEDMAITVPYVLAHAQSCEIIGDKERAADDYRLALCLARVDSDAHCRLDGIYYARAHLRYELRDYFGSAIDLLRCYFRQVFRTAH
ncbi:hypothetical protein KF728_02715 [Candidatus Obscuribacterales bacterium]|nr:hypothetical protein [Candidatus Obscuribacterales bacterium]MBX3149042.1 hypothetical protein [Candidatus Obscuribacterales bacterium]